MKEFVQVTVVIVTVSYLAMALAYTVAGRFGEAAAMIFCGLGSIVLLGGNARDEGWINGD